MTQDEIIRMAREAGFRGALDGEHDMVADFEHLHRFAALVAAHEREACAKVVESGVLGHGECAADREKNHG